MPLNGDLEFSKRRLTAPLGSGPTLSYSFHLNISGTTRPTRAIRGTWVERANWPSGSVGASGSAR